MGFRDSEEKPCASSSSPPPWPLRTAGLAAVAAPAQAGVPWLVTVKADAHPGHLGQTVSFSGKVTPGGKAAGLKVVLQEKAARAGRASDTDKLNARGRYHLSDKPTVNTSRQYRVVMPGHGAHAKGDEPEGQGRRSTAGATVRPPVGQLGRHVTGRSRST